MTIYNVSLQKEKSLLDRMVRLGIKESDIREQFIRSGGHGGQNVNKVATCVYIKHIPTGIEVKCQRERSQAMNRFLARRILADKVEQMVLGKESAEERAREKIRRQKRRRSRRAKDKMLKEKKLHSTKKQLRSFKLEDY